MTEPENVYWLLDRIKDMRTFNAVVDAIADLKLDNVNDPVDQQIYDALERYQDHGVNIDVAVMAIQRFYSRLYELGASMSMVQLTNRSSAPYISIEKLNDSV